MPDALSGFSTRRLSRSVINPRHLRWLTLQLVLETWKPGNPGARPARGRRREPKPTIPFAVACSVRGYRFQSISRWPRRGPHACTAAYIQCTPYILPIRPHHHARLVFRISSASASTVYICSSYGWGLVGNGYVLVRTSRRCTRAWVNPGRWIHPFNPFNPCPVTIPAPPLQKVPRASPPSSPSYRPYFTYEPHHAIGPCSVRNYPSSGPPFLQSNRPHFNRCEASTLVSWPFWTERSPPVSLDTLSTYKSKRPLCYASFGHAFIHSCTRPVVRPLATGMSLYIVHDPSLAAVPYIRVSA